MAAPVDLWAITSFFNPSRYHRRLANYRLFRKYLQFPLIAVELSYDSAFELQPDDAHVLVQLRGGDIMWQKERLLNIALQALPDECRKVVWIDCDTLIAADDWAWRVSQALDDFPLLQPYSRVGHLPRDMSLHALPTSGDVEAWRPSVVAAIGTGLPAQECLQRPLAQSPGHSGSVWAARRDLLDAYGFYDTCIVGGGDLAMACAGYGCFAEAMHRQSMNERQRDYYLAWAKPFYKSVQGRVSFLDDIIYHLWHGTKSDRSYLQRHDGLRDFAFDPTCDIALADNGVWRWNSDKPLLHRYVKDYFASRKEDG